ncbi:MAG: hypothetical protein DRG78_23965 [Epsilonproteobacteria bacterium]|nr:MAG: hypothetical protein DRG78_23965 [Campylobacterota bacterium]
MFKEYNILCVDDESINLDIVTEILHYYTVYPAIDALNAFDILDKIDIDLILLDVMMPNTNGFELCKQIKNEDKINDIPILFITADNKDETISSAFEHGGVDFIKKPLSMIDLQQRVKFHLKQNSAFIINDHFYFDKKLMILYKDKTIVKLSKSEQRLLKLFINKKNIPIDPIEISAYIYDDYTKEYSNKTIRNIISSLRGKVPKGLITNHYDQ